MTNHTFLPTTNVEASQKEYLIASKLLIFIIGLLIYSKFDFKIYAKYP